MSSWYKRESHGTTYYCLEPAYKDVYFLAKDSQPSSVKSLLEELGNNKELKSIHVCNSGVPSIIEAEQQVSENKTNLSAGHYIFACNNGYNYPDRLIKRDFRKDKYLPVFNESNEIIVQIDKFLDNEHIYRSIDENMIYKFGVLLYGPPGEGKTSLIRHLVNTHDKFKDAIIITLTDEFPPAYFLQRLNQTTKGQLKVFIFEELTNLTQHASGIEYILTFLDGETSIDNSICFATTNYPEMLPQNLVERPSRFDKLYKISSPKADERKKLISYFYGQEPTSDDIKMTDGQSSAFIKEICLNARRNQISLSDSLKQIKEIFEVVKKDFKDTKLGF